MNLTRISSFAALACLCLSCPSMAQDPGSRGWYAGLDFGQSRLDQDTTAAAVVDRDDTSNAWALRVGYRFVKYFALEGGYTDLGEFESTYVPFCGLTPPSACPSARAGISMDGFLLNAVGTWPIAEHFHLKGNLGAIYRELKATIDDNDYTSSGGWTDSDTAFSLGLGIAVPINPHFEIDLDYTWYRQTGLGLDMDGNVLVLDENEAGVAMLGLRYRF
jgi:OmpA-OmpF porin, OOP family